ncbi:hypothetical protein VM636_04630 [Streptomyces sp. SCSIO 75703]|uniref:hypothetical protein n=1 Tax=Streptomyces sp. SCSIO 75703 TaxID=3112165 RepID=UPI0030CFA681
MDGIEGEPAERVAARRANGDAPAPHAVRDLVIGLDGRHLRRRGDFASVSIAMTSQVSSDAAGPGEGVAGGFCPHRVFSYS